MSLLAHIVGVEKLKPEPTATRSLAYILRSSPELVASLVELVLPDVEFEPGRVESERKLGGGSIPDLTIFDSRDRPRIFIENKFWAGLTDPQPVQYLAALPADPPSGLVFIVPAQRIPNVWIELKSRIRDPAFDSGKEPSSDSTTRLQLGTRTLCVTSWRDVLGLLKRVKLKDDLRSNVLQLGGLAKFGELDGFPPLRGQELSDVSTPKRMIDFCRLVPDIVSKLEYRDVAQTKGCNPQADWNDTGRYFNVLEQFGFWLGVSLLPWRNTGITPLWLRIYPDSISNLGEHYRRLDEYFEDVEVGTDRTYIPIRLLAGVERDEVIMHAADRVQRIAEELRERTGASIRAAEAP